MFALAVNGGRLLYRPHIPMRREDTVRTGFVEPDQFEAVRPHLPAALRAVVGRSSARKCHMRLQPASL